MNCMVYEWYLNRYTHTHTHTKYLWKVWQQKNLTDLLGQSSLRLMNSQCPQHLLASSPVRKPSEERRQKDSCYLGIATHTNQTGRRNLSISLPVPLSEDSCVVCHLKPADEGGTHPRENSNACLDRALVQKLFFYFSDLRILIPLVTVYLWWCMNAWLILWLLAPQCWELTKVHFTYSRDSAGLLPNLPPGSHNREFF